ncbi:hypothetical protein EES47_17585 [Streptomyces sp. ADI98-12]|nr:hypothetical protein EES47_17585 [Streptomyces sp. ADI98-12]
MTPRRLSPLPDGHGVRTARPTHALSPYRPTALLTAPVPLLPRDALCGRYHHGDS